MKIFLVIEDTLHKLPKTWNATYAETFKIASKYQVTSEQVELRKINATEYEVSVSEVLGTLRFDIVDEDSGIIFDYIEIEIFRDAPDTEKLEWWLTQNQLDYLIPICKQFGWGKLKEATLKARSLSTMQGTEYALQEILKLFEIDDNIELERIWISNGAEVSYGSKGELIVLNGEKAYSNLHAAGLARKEFHLSNFLKLHYKEDDFDSWYDKIRPASGKLTPALQDILLLLSESMPATLRIKDIELVRLGISLIYFGITSMQSEIRYADVVVQPMISIQTILQYEYLQFVYDKITNEFIRIADKHENYDAIYAVQLQIHCPSKFYNLTLSDDNDKQLCYLREAEGTKSLIVTPNINSKVIKFRYRTDTGALIDSSVDVTILKACHYLPVLQFNRAIQSNQVHEFTDSHKLYEACLADVLKQYREQTIICDAKVPTFLWDKVPAGYVLFYIPVTEETVYVNDGIETKTYEVSDGIPGYSLDKTKLNVINPKDYSSEEQEFYVLWSLQYQGTYDVSMYYISDNEIVYVQQENRYLTEWINPFWTVNILKEKILSKSCSVVNDKNGETIQINNGNPLPNTTEYPDVWRDIDSISGDMHCNFGFDGTKERLDSVSFYTRHARLDYTDGSLINTMRKPSIQMSIAHNIRPHLPYCIFMYDSQFDLYFEDTLIKTSQSALIFSAVKTGAYKIHVHNEWYDKLIHINV